MICEYKHPIVPSQYCFTNYCVISFISETLVNEWVLWRWTKSSIKVIIETYDTVTVSAFGPAVRKLFDLAVDFRDCFLSVPAF